MTDPGSTNREVWLHKDIVSQYAGKDLLQPAESAIFDKYREHLAGKRVLDIGCGTGRTTGFLREQTERYRGIDYSADMVSCCRRRFPQAKIQECDMRDMSIFSDGSFDFMLCSFNSIDYISHDDRILALKEMRRVLVESGLLVFSTHNRNCRGIRPAPSFCWSWHPLRFAANAFAFLEERRNYKANEGRQVDEADYAIINDSAHCYSLLTYYIDRDKQNQQLETAGFEILDIYDKFGARVGEDDNAEKAPWLYYVCRKTA